MCKTSTISNVLLLKSIGNGVPSHLELRVIALNEIRNGRRRDIGTFKTLNDYYEALNSFC